MRAAKFSALNSETPVARGFGVLGVGKILEAGGSVAGNRTWPIGLSRKFSALNSGRSWVEGPEERDPIRGGGRPRTRTRGSGPGGKFSALNFDTPGNRGFAFLGVGKVAGCAPSGPGTQGVRPGSAQKFSALNSSESVQPGRGKMPFHASQ